MRLLSLVALIAFVSSYTAATNTDKTGVNSGIVFVRRALASNRKQGKWSLRQYDFNELDETESDNEERVGIPVDKVDYIVNKADDVLGKVSRGAQKLPKGVNVAKLDDMVNKIDNIAERVAKYPAGLSKATLRQIQQVEMLRSTDLMKISKTSGKSMRRVIEDFPGIKRVPEKYLESHIGRGDQIVEEGRRVLSVGVVSRSEGAGDVLLISSSNPKKNDWLLPKGGWDEGEDIATAALREVVEEGGVKGQLLHKLGRVDFKNKDDKLYRYYPYMVKAGTVFDDWAESVRYRLWVSYDDAVKMLGNRKDMVDIVKAAEELSKKGTKIDENLAKIKLNGLE